MSARVPLHLPSINLKLVILLAELNELSRTPKPVNFLSIELVEPSMLLIWEAKLVAGEGVLVASLGLAELGLLEETFSYLSAFWYNEFFLRCLSSLDPGTLEFL